MKILFLDDVREIGGKNAQHARSGSGTQGNLGMEYVAAVVQEKGHSVLVLQPPLNDVTEEEIMTHIGKADIVAMSSMTWNAPRIIAMAQKIRGIFPRTLLAVGGIGPTSMPGFYAPHFDAVFVGEGEQAFLNWLEERSRWKIIKASRNPGWTGDPLPLRNLEVMRRSRMRGIWPIPYDEQVVANMLYGRGCYGNCYFCSSPIIWEKKVIWRDPRSVAEEMLMLAEVYGVNSVDFIDPTFNAKSQKVLDLCSEFIRQGVRRKILWTAMISPSKRTGAEEVLVAMREAGCIKVGVGIEDPTAEMRRKLQKGGSNIDHCREVLQIASDLGILARAFIIVGAPGQTDKNIDTIREMVCAWPIDELRMSIFCPFPGTQAWGDLDRQNMIKTKDFSLYDTNHPVIKSHWSDGELLSIHRDLTKTFYADNAGYWKRRKQHIAADSSYEIAYKQFDKGFLKPRGYLP
ncbi:MAG: radical SAM protein [Patescibacteria group bacterium]|nr:radical SAM protein [Patescibacteria group bacterium]